MLDAQLGYFATVQSCAKGLTPLPASSVPITAILRLRFTPRIERKVLMVSKFTVSALGAGPCAERLLHEAVDQLQKWTVGGDPPNARVYVSAAAAA